VTEDTKNTVLKAKRVSGFL